MSKDSKEAKIIGLLSEARALAKIAGIEIGGPSELWVGNLETGIVW